MIEFKHKSVLLEEVMSLCPQQKEGGVFVDCTSGGGGHSRALLEKLGPRGTLVCIDQDTEAINFLKQKGPKSREGQTVHIVKSRFSSVGEILKSLNLFGKVDFMLADLGVSSPQLDAPERGFSFQSDGPLDMRMDSENQLEALTVVNTFSPQELSKIFWRFGEEKQAKRVAQAIADRRVHAPIKTTGELAQLVKDTVRFKKPSKKHPATKVFQALRIFVNRELEEIEILLQNSISILRPKGRLAVITFHSLEDRLVKEYYKKQSGTAASSILSKLPLTAEQESLHNPSAIKILKPFPIVPSEKEITANPRSRSAKLRVFEKK